jgi:hypothetical protein
MYMCANAWLGLCMMYMALYMETCTGLVLGLMIYEEEQEEGMRF